MKQIFYTVNLLFFALFSFQSYAQFAGSLDSSFNGNGKLFVDFNGNFDYGQSVVLQINGKIVIAGASSTAHTDFAVTRLNSDGSLDNSFDADGKTTIPVGAGDDWANAVAIQQDGKIVVAGYSYNANGNDFSIIRLNTDGSLDNTFNTSGKLIIPVSANGDDYGNSLALQPDGKIVVAGYSYNGSETDFSIIRVNTNGSLDNSFDGDGKLLIPVGTGNDRAYSVLQQQDGKLVLSGYSVNSSFVVLSIVRLNSDGSLDNSFNGNGKLMVNVNNSNPAGYAAAIQPDGKIIVAGNVYNGSTASDFCFIRVDSNGTLDNSFDNDGISIIPVGPGSAADGARAIELQADGKIIAGGYSYPGSYADFAMVRLNVDGSLDNSFNGNGKNIISLGVGNDLLYSIALQPDGKIVAAGYSETENFDDFSLIRLIGAPRTYTLSCHADTTITAAYGSGCIAIVNKIDPVITPQGNILVDYTLSGATLGSGTGSASGSTFNKGTTTVLYSINDGSGLQTCSFNVIVNAPAELCNGEDDDCDGVIDNGIPQQTYYRDADGDGYGDNNNSIQSCSQQTGYVTDNTDCDDIDNTVYPAATEICDGKDNDCNGQIDDGLIITYYKDNDGDGYGDAGNSIQNCSQPPGYVTNNTDCNDNDNNIYPGAPELCDGKDNNCNGTFDEGCILSETPPVKQWDKTFGGNVDDDLFALQQTADGGYILGGSSNSMLSYDKSENNKGGYDYWVVKIDANGVKQWDKTFGGSHDDHLTSLQQTTDGGYILGGYSLSNAGGDKSEYNKGGYDYWVVKIDANGVKQWDKTFGGSPGGSGNDDLLYSLQQTTDGGYILGGFSYSNAGWDKSENNRGYSDYWVIKIDANGAKRWDKTFGGSSLDNLESLQQTKDGGYILGGYSYSNADGDKSENNKGGYDYWVVKIDANGAEQWDNTFGGSSDDNLSSLQQTTDGGYILGGYSLSNAGGDKSENSRAFPFTDFWVIKIDANGVKQWDKTLGGSNNDNLESLQQTKDGGYVLGGWSASNAGSDKSENENGAEDYWLVKINANGAKQWDKTYGGSGFDGLWSLQQTTDGGYILGGYSNSNAGGDKTENSRGGQFVDYWIIKTMPDCIRVTYYRDADGDGYGDINNSIQSCSQQTGYVTDNTDCDDNDNTIYPDAPELCDGKDNDCNGVIDDGCTPLIARISINGTGNNAGSTCSGESVSLDGSATTGGIPPYTFSWDLNNDGIYNDATGMTISTIYNGTIGIVYSVCLKVTDALGKISSTCGTVTIVAPSIYYRDVDDDGFGDPNNSIQSCSPQSGYVSDNTDCNDNENTIHPGAPEICDGKDNDCDGMIDEDVTKPVVTANGSTSDVCPGKTVKLTSSTASSYLWSNGATTQSIIISAAGSYTVTVTYADGCQSTSNPTIVTYQGCIAPTGLETNNITSTSAKIKWNAVSCAIGYRYQYRKKGTAAWTTTQLIGTTKTLTGLSSNTTYQWRVLTGCQKKPTVIVSAYTNGPEFTTAKVATFENGNSGNSNVVAQRTVVISPNPATNIINVEIKGYTGNVTIELMDLEGKVLSQEKLQTGMLKYTQQPINVVAIASGTYFLRVIDEKGNRQTEKVVIAR